MKKIDPHSVGAVLTCVLIAISIIVMFYTWGVLNTVLFIGGFAVLFGFPYAVSWFWNRYIADEDQDDQEQER